MKIVAVIFILLFLFSSCSSIKLAKTLQKGEIESKTFIQSVPFTYRLGLIIIPVEIEGKTYQFLLDTGAPNVISTTLAKEIIQTKSFGHKASDSQGGKSELEFVTVDKITIGGIDFKNTGAAIADLSQSNEVACLKIDGIIGSNLMRLCKWKIDYDLQQLTFSDNLVDLGVDSSFTTLKFEPELTGTPKINIELEGQKIENVKFDTGSVGFLDLPTSAFEKAKKSGNEYVVVKSFGVNGSGLFGPGEDDTMYYAQINSVKIANIEVKNRVIEFVKGNSSLLGTQFFKNFTVYFDWQAKEIYLEQKKQLEEKPFETFGFNVFYSEDKLLIKEIFEHSKASELGLKNGDQILSINGKDYRDFTKQDWCEFIEISFFKELKEIDMEVLKEGNTQRILLVKQNLFIQH